jgi:hypothetical protein
MIRLLQSEEGLTLLEHLLEHPNDFFFFPILHLSNICTFIGNKSNDNYRCIVI